MSQTHISPALEDLPRAIVAAFSDAQDVIAERAFKGGWKDQIVEIDLIDTGNYLAAVEVEEAVTIARTLRVVIDAPRASSYAAAIKRKGESDYAGQRVAEDAIRGAEGEILAELDRAGDRLK